MTRRMAQTILCILVISVFSLTGCGEDNPSKEEGFVPPVVIEKLDEVETKETSETSSSAKEMQKDNTEEKSGIEQKIYNNKGTVSKNYEADSEQSEKNASDNGIKEKKEVLVEEKAEVKTEGQAEVKVEEKTEASNEEGVEENSSTVEMPEESISQEKEIVNTGGNIQDVSTDGDIVEPNFGDIKKNDSNREMEKNEGNLFNNGGQLTENFGTNEGNLDMNQGAIEENFSDAIQ